MSIVGSNAVYFGQGPVAGGSTILAFGGTSNQELSYMGTANLVGDNSSTVFFINWIDGTNALSFIPTAVVATRQAGNATSTIAVLAISAISNTQCSVTLSAAPGTNATATVAFICFK